MEVRTFVASDIHCEGCVASIRRSLGKVAGVHDVDVNVQDRTVTVTFDPALTGVAALMDRLDQAGFPVA